MLVYMNERSTNSFTIDFTVCKYVLAYQKKMWSLFILKYYNKKQKTNHKK